MQMRDPVYDSAVPVPTIDLNRPPIRWQTILIYGLLMFSAGMWLGVLMSK
jgi:hypothetical protein